MHSNF